ncbi:MAG TPA: RcnB family protein [Caulobacteraceae bacterium]
MKRAFLALATATALGLSLAPAGGALAQNWNHGEGRGHGGGDHGGGDRGFGDRGGGNRGGENRGGGRGGSNARPAPGYSDERGPRVYRDHDGGHWGGGGPPPAFRGERWDDHRNNGYWVNNRWHYGPPPDEYYGRPGFSLGHSDWRLGGYLPPYYRGWVVSDYARWRLRRPPYGYNWIRVGNDYLLVAASSGLIFDIVRY